jgi:O-antigen/teichoic acid export membrane protein
LNKTFRNILLVFTAFSLSKIIGAFTSFAIPKILEPADYGVWITLLLVISYSPIVALGTVETLLKEYPYHVGRGDFSKAAIIESSTFGSIILSSIFLIIIGLSIPVIVSYPPVIKYLNQIRIIFFASAASLYGAFYFHRFAAHQKFQYYGVVDTTRAVITFLFVLSFAWSWGLQGAVYGYFVMEVTLFIFIMLLSNKYCGFVKPSFNTRDIWRSVKIGLPITIVWWGLSFQSSVDRLVSSTMLGKIQTGYYGLGISIVSTIVLIPHAVNRVLYPKINERVGQDSAHADLARIVMYPARIFSIILPLFTGSLVIVSPLVYTYIFPKYLPGLASAQILILGFFFMGLIGNGINFLLAKDKQNQMFFVVLACIAINFACAFVFVKSGMNIEGVALGTGISAAVLATNVWFMVLSNIGYSNKEVWKEISILYSPFILALSFMGIIYLLSPEGLNCSSKMSLAYLAAFVVSYMVTIYNVSPFKRVSREMSLFVLSGIGYVKTQNAKG